MQTYPEQFPQDHRTDPKRQAEARIFDAIQASCRPGFAYYEWKRDHHSPEVDFALWLLGVGRFSLQVKGGGTVTEKWQMVSGNPDRPTGDGVPIP